MKKALLAAYIFFCTGGTYAQTFCAHAVNNCQCNPQQRQNTVVAEIDFNRPLLEIYVNRAAMKPDTIRATLLLSRGHMRIAHERMGYAVIKKKVDVTVQNKKVIDQQLKYDTTYYDDRMRPIKAPWTVWGMIRKEGKP